MPLVFLVKEKEKKEQKKKYLGPHEVYAATSIMMPPIRQMFIHVH